MLDASDFCSARVVAEPEREDGDCHNRIYIPPDDTEEWTLWRPDADGEWRVVFDAGSDSSKAPSDEVRALLDQKDDCKM